MSCFRYAFFGGRSASSSSSSSRRRRRRGGEGGRRRRKTRATTIHYSRATWLPSVRPSVRLCPSVSVCVCVLLFFEAKSAVFLFFFLLVPHTKNKITHPHIIDCASLLLNNIFTRGNQSINQFDSFILHTHTLSLNLSY